jgi:hypothetical protein
VTGGTGTITYSIKAGGSIDSGLTFNTADGSISGTPALIGTYTYTIVATDSVLATAESAPLSMTINALPVITTGSLPAWTVNIAGYSEQLTWTDGTAPFIWSWAPDPNFGTITPPGLSINSTTGLISGTPTVSSAYNLAITITDAALQTNTIFVQLNIYITPELVSSLPDSTETVNYNQATYYQGGTLPCTFTVDSGGTLPPGTSLNSATGVISGSLNGYTVPGTADFTITVVDACGATVSQPYSVTIYDVPVISPPSGTLPNGTIGIPYSETFTITGGGFPPVDFSPISSSNLPPGFSFDETTGILSGTPTEQNLYSISVEAVDAYGGSAQNSYQLYTYP